MNLHHKGVNNECPSTSTLQGPDRYRNKEEPETIFAQATLWLVKRGGETEDG